MDLETRWMAESLYQIWKSGATVGINFLLQDMPQNTPFQSGLYLASVLLSNAQAKPLLSPFQFPFVAYLKTKKGKVSLWGRDATSDQRDVTIQRRIGANGSWVTVATITSNSHGIFLANLIQLHAASNWWLRAHATGSGDSTPFALKVPGAENKKVVPFPLNG
jgi:hypothetical protein